MKEEQRAQEYARLFERLGDKWRSCVPVDAKVCGSDVYIGSVAIERISPKRWAPVVLKGQVWERLQGNTFQQVDILEVGIARATVRGQKTSDVLLDVIQRRYRLVASPETGEGAGK